ncbi:LysE family translocator [Thermophilibacter sp.]
MLGIVGYGGFVASAAALCLTPGIDTVYILTRTVAGGRAEGLASALGINTGLVVHTLLVAAGLSLVLAASPVAFGAIKVAGAAYLVVMGARSVVGALRGDVTSFSALGERDGDGAGPGSGGATRAGTLRTYAQGVLTNVLNPKIILFFLALLPQFVATPNPYGPLPFLALGLTYVALSTLWTVVIVAVAAPFSGLLRRSPRAGRVTGVVSGLVYVALGAMIFLT